MPEESSTEEEYPILYAASEDYPVLPTDSPYKKVYWTERKPGDVVFQVSVFSEDSAALVKELISTPFNKDVIIQSGAPYNPPKYPPGS